MPRESSSVWVLPTISAPASTSACTTGAVRDAGGCSASQSGLPAPVTWPAMSNRSLAANLRPESGRPGAPCNRAVEWGQKPFKGSRRGVFTVGFSSVALGARHASPLRIADHGLHRCLGGGKAGELGKRNRLHRRAQAVVADLLR